MKCILCKMCETAHAKFDKKMDAWLYEQSNHVEIMQRETDPAAVYEAYEQTDKAESFKQFPCARRERISLVDGRGRTNVSSSNRHYKGFGAS
ncbi:hypothetical protein [Bradyrhizobium sp.]|uniref:hypothetical protein n=1 Tax=Bradyrhizobium sp. TaxID=376 RepID=UPI003C49FB3F